MARNLSHTRIYSIIARTLELLPCKRGDLINGTLRGLKLTKEELDDRSIGSLYSRLRSRIGTIITEMQNDKLIVEDADGYYSLAEARAAVIRLERCEKEIVTALSEKAYTKKELRDRLASIFGTDKTATRKDDELLNEYIGRVTKKMLSAGIIVLQDGFYALAPKISAKAKDVNAILALKEEFLNRLHSKGGEFFENYFMELLKTYYQKSGKQIMYCAVTGGTADGGIDGILKTRDELGFVETVMVQTKNRHELSSETEVRSFYGAVYAKRGTRGIFATSSDFHYSASAFLEGLDDCIGINGSKIFKMAIDCEYGIKKISNKLTIDDKIIQK